MGGGAWRATVHRVAKSRTQLKQLNTHAGFINVKYTETVNIHNS